MIQVNRYCRSCSPQVWNKSAPRCHPLPKIPLRTNPKVSMKISQLGLIYILKLLLKLTMPVPCACLCRHRAPELCACLSGADAHARVLAANGDVHRWAHLGAGRERRVHGVAHELAEGLLVSHTALVNGREGLEEQGGRPCAMSVLSPIGCRSCLQSSREILSQLMLLP